MMQDHLETLTRLQLALALDYRIVPLDAADAPIFLAVSVPLEPTITGCKPRLPSGRGTTWLQAMVSSGAEALELRASLAQNNAARIAALPRRAEQAVVEARDLLTDESVAVPAQQVFLDLAAVTGEVLATDARSTGCAVGKTRTDAARMALFECIERDAIAFWWHGDVAASALTNDLIDAREPRLVWWLEQRPRRFQLLGLQSEAGVPVVVAVSADADGRNVVTGSAARFDAGAAALSAVTELIQTEVSYERALKAGHSDATTWQAYASTLTLPQFDPPTEGPPQSWRALDDSALLRRLADIGLRALAVELTLPEDPLVCLRVLVPGLCDMAGRIDVPRFRQRCGLPDSPAPLPRLRPEPF